MGDDDGNEDDSVILLDGEVSEREEEPANRATPVGRNRNHLQCVVCMEECEVQGEHMPFTLRCGHAFGGSCIRSWLHAGWGTCPTCKQRAESQHLRPLRLPAGAPAVVRDASELEEERKRSGRERERAEKAERELKRAKADLKRAHEQLKHAHAAKRSADPSLPSHDKRPRPAGELVQCSGASAIALRSGILSACACDRVLSAPFNRPGSMVAGAALRGRATCAEAGGEGGERLAAATPDAERGLKVASLSHGSLALEMALPRKPTCLAWHPRDNSIVLVGMAGSCLGVVDMRMPRELLAELPTMMAKRFGGIASLSAVCPPAANEAAVVGSPQGATLKATEGIDEGFAEGRETTLLHSASPCCSLTAVGGSALVAGDAGLLELDVNSGEPRWKFSGTGMVDCSFAGDFALGVSPAGEVTAFKAGGEQSFAIQGHTASAKVVEGDGHSLAVLGCDEISVHRLTPS